MKLNVPEGGSIGGYSRKAQRQPSSMTVSHGRAWVEPYAHATLFTKLHTTKNGAGNKHMVSVSLCREQTSSTLLSSYDNGIWWRMLHCLLKQRYNYLGQIKKNVKKYFLSCMNAESPGRQMDSYGKRSNLEL